MTNRVCSDHCGRALTEYVNKPGVEVTAQSHGVIGDRIIDEDALGELKDAYGPGRAIDLVSKELVSRDPVSVT